VSCIWSVDCLLSYWSTAVGWLPVIMIGPGTGIAPFRAFIEERAATGATGNNWLFFGDQHEASYFLYKSEWDTYLESGVLSKLDLAFSRDQAEKIYVQDRMRENAAEIWEWISAGGYFYVCGDASRMAKDVNTALIDIAAEHGGMDEKEAAAYIKQMQKREALRPRRLLGSLFIKGFTSNVAQASSLFNHS